VVSRPEYSISRLSIKSRKQCRHTSNGHPVVDNHSRAYNGTSSVDATSDKRDLQQTRQLVLILDARLGMHNATLIAQRHVATRQDVVRDCLPENLDA
jgi:hypothetical protein